ncbi:MAG: DUF1287 domain-containing protein [Candidatus Pacebacteria bacterium]|nr:DUF1287 domain-containing protein [Candidatus Paceibacterota bacterium]
MQKKIIILILILFFTFCFLKIFVFSYNTVNTNEELSVLNQETNTHPLVESARNQIGIVTKYDNQYYNGGYPPEGRGACTDVIRALMDQGYDLKNKIDKDMLNFPEEYPYKSDPNINYRRVVNLKIFFDRYFEKIDLEQDWQPGDIVTYDQIPGGLWHIAILSDKKNKDGIPLLIHNYGRGVIEDDFLFKWPAAITGHYRLRV